MQPYPVAHVGFDGMAKGVAQVEGGAHARLTFVGTHHGGLGCAGTLNGRGQRGLIQGAQGVNVFFQPGQKRLVANQAVLDHFRQPCRQFACWQGVQAGGVDEYQIWLVKRAHHVFAQRVIDAGFAAYGRIHLRQQSGRHLNEVDPALVTRCGKTGHVTDHATTQCNDRGAPIMARREQAIENQLQGFPIFE